MKKQDYEQLIEKKQFEPLWLDLLNASGYAGVLPNGGLVDRRYYPEAVPVQANSIFGLNEPKELENEIPEEDINFKVFWQSGVQVLVEKSWDDEDEIPAISISFFMESLKASYKYSFIEFDKRDEKFKNYKSEDAITFINAFKKMINDSQNEE